MAFKRTYFRKLVLFSVQFIRVCRTHKRSTALWVGSLWYSFVLLFVFFGPFFRIGKEICRTNRLPQCPDFVIPELRKYRQQLIYLVPVHSLAYKLKQNIPQARDVMVMRKWPNTVDTQILWLDPIAQVGIPASTSAYLVADTGRIIGSTDEKDSRLPLIVATSAADLIINQTITDSSVVTAFDAIKFLYGSANPVSEVSINSPFDIRLSLQKGETVIMTSMKPTEIQVRSLQLILSQTTMDQRNQIIDVRYDKSVIKPVPY